MLLLVVVGNQALLKLFKASESYRKLLKVNENFFELFLRNKVSF
jgi:hypothetical protein